MPDEVTIRMAGPADAAALHVLEELDSRRLPQGEVLVAEVGGEVRAALPVDGGDAVADPFRPTAPLIELLAVHAAQRRSGATRHATPLRRAAALALR